MARLSIIDALQDRAARRPEQEALIYLHDRGEPERLDAAAVWTGATRCGARLREHGVGPGHVVLIAVDHGLPQALTLLGALQIGALPCLFPALAPKLDPDGFARRVDAVVQRLRPDAIVTDQDAFATNGEAVIVRAAAIAAEGDVAPAPVRTTGGETAFLQLSSGSTGRQNVIPVSDAAVIGMAAARGRAMDTQDTDVVVGWVPLYHDLGLIGNLLSPLIEGVTAVLMSPLEWLARPALLMEAVHRHGGTVCSMPNFAFNHCVRRIRDEEMADLRLDGWRVLANGAEPVRPESFTAFADRFARWGFNARAFLSGYGLAEHTLTATVTPLGTPPRVDRVDRGRLQREQRAEPATSSADAAVFVSCGEPLDGVAVQIRRGDGPPLGERSVGEVFLRSPFVFAGYRNDPERTREVLHDGWLATGDLGYIAEGELFICGRLKDLIIVGGANVSAEDVEAAVRGTPGVKPGRVVAFGVPDARSGSETIVLVAEVPSPVDSATAGIIEQELRQRVRREVGVTIGHVALVPPNWIAKTTSGKLARWETRERWHARTDGHAPGAAV